MKSLIVGNLLLLPFVSGQVPPPSAEPTAVGSQQLVGTWTTSSKKVVTGPAFYDPVNDKFFEPSLPGISYSFTSDGWYEEAYYRAVPNPQDPSCTSAIMQWQHGNYQLLPNNSLVLTPIAVDGRQQASEAESCNRYGQSVYTRYSQAEIFQSWEVITDRYHGVQRLNLFKFDGSPMNPMYLEYAPTPQMLPTQTLNPTSSSTSAGSQATSTSASTKRKRSEQAAFGISARTKVLLDKNSALLNPDHWWWFGVGATALGGFAYLAF